MNIDWKHLFLSFNGRINRQPYWIGSLLLAVSGGIAMVLLAANIGTWKNSTDMSVDMLIVAMFGIAAVVIFCSLALSVKRLHDRNKPGWWMALF